MSLIRKIKNSKLFSSSNKNNNNSINNTLNHNDSKKLISSNKQEEFSNSLNVDTTVLSANTSTTLSSPFSNNTNKTNTLVWSKINNLKSPNGTLDKTNRNSIDLKKRNLIVYHIDSETEGNFSLTVQDDELGDYVLNAVCTHYNLSDYREYFGLKYTLVDDNGDHEIFWLDPLKSIAKQLKDTNNVLTFRVKHFPGKPQLIESEYVRYLIFLQIRNYFLKGDLQLSTNDENILASYAIQASLGDYELELYENNQNYLQELKFLSRKALKSQEIIIELHKQLKGKTPSEMELAFLEKASQFDTYGAELIVVKNSKGVAINFGVSHNGIITYLHGQASDIPKIGLYPWTQIGKISYEGRSLKVSAHTPDNKNPEVIKKHVMLFKCNNKRICKHLWKFILDQKSFFNFKCGSDVPQIKSSNRLFSRKSKFRYSGRCESELIKQQHEPKPPSINNISPISVASSQSVMTTDGNNFSRSNTFKRRTFLSVQRVTIAHNNKSNSNDTNNNNLLIKANNEEEINRKSGSNMNNDNNAETSSQLSQSTVITHNSINKNNNNNEANSTPQLKFKNEAEKEDDEKLIKEELYDSVEPLTLRHNKNLKQRNSKINFTLSDEISTNNSDGDDRLDDDATDDENEEEKFYDHDECPTQFETIMSSKKSNGSLTKMSSSNLQNSSINLIKFTNENNKINKSGGSRLKVIIIIGSVIVLFAIFLFYYYYKSYNSNNNSNSLERILYLKFRKTKNLILNYLTGDKSQNSFISWPPNEGSSTAKAISSTSCRNDPLFNWFLSQYAPKSSD